MSVSPPKSSWSFQLLLVLPHQEITRGNLIWLTAPYIITLQILLNLFLTEHKHTSSNVPVLHFMVWVYIFSSANPKKDI